MAIGQGIYMLCRKRAGNPYAFVRCNNLQLSLITRASAAVTIVGNDLENPSIDWLAQSESGGLIAGNAGGVVLLDVRGTFSSNNFETYGLCDDNINIRTRLWDWLIVGTVAAGATSLVVDFNTSDSPNVLPTRPRDNDLLEFWNPDGILVKSVRIVGTTPNPSTTPPVENGTARFADNLDSPVPAGYVNSTRTTDAWLTLNRSMVPRWRMGNVKQVGGIRTIFAQSHDWSIAKLHAENLRQVAVRHGFPASGAHTTLGGARGGGYIGVMTTKNCVHRYTKDSNAVVNLRMLRSTGGAAIVNQGFPPVVIDRLEVDGCGYGVTYAAGLDLQVKSRAMRATGSRRATTGVNAGLPGGNDDYAEYGSITAVADAPYPPYRQLVGTAGVIGRSLAQRSFNADFLTLGAGGVVTIDSAAITVSQARHRVNAPVASPQLPLDLYTINAIDGLMDGQLLLIRLANGGRPVTVKKMTTIGNLNLVGGDYAFTTTLGHLLLIYDGFAGTWLEVARAKP